MKKIISKTGVTMLMAVAFATALMAVNRRNSSLASTGSPNYYAPNPGGAAGESGSDSGKYLQRCQSEFTIVVTNGDAICEKKKKNTIAVSATCAAGKFTVDSEVDKSGAKIVDVCVNSNGSKGSVTCGTKDGKSTVVKITPHKGTDTCAYSIDATYLHKPGCMTGNCVNPSDPNIRVKCADPKHLFTTGNGAVCRKSN